MWEILLLDFFDWEILLLDFFDVGDFAAGLFSSWTNEQASHLLVHSLFMSFSNISFFVS